MKILALTCLAQSCLVVTLAAPQRAQADVSASSQLTINDIGITPSSGSLVMLTNWTGAAFGQATVNEQYDAGAAPSVLVTGDYSTAAGSATGAVPGAQSSTSGSVLGVNGADNAAGEGWITSVFEITGGSGEVSTLFSAQIAGSLNGLADLNGQLAQSETVFSFEVDGGAVLFNDQFFSVGSSASFSTNFNTSVSGSSELQFDTPYTVYVESDSELSISNVPEPAAAGLLAGGAAILAWIARRKIGVRPRPLVTLVLLGSMAGAAHATYIGGDSPDVCLVCGAQATRQPGGAVSTSLTEGNLREDYPVATLQSSGGPTIQLSLVYNTYNADGSQAEVDTGLGIGWTHSYNRFLFQQRGSYFQMGPDGRVTLYQFGPGGYTSDNGYFETLSPQPDGSVIITNKFKSWWRFAAVPGSTLLVRSPVLNLIQSGDRNGNITTCNYTGGLMTQIVDTYGRTITLGYTSRHLSSVTDPLGRVTSIQYDSRFRTPIRITDPNGYVTRYSYNAMYQMTRKIDRDSLTYYYIYRNQTPWAVTDENGQAYFSMQNSNDWEVNHYALALSLRRTYVPSTVTNTDGNGNIWRYQYDTNGYITTAIEPDGAITSYAYDPLLRTVTAKTNADGAITRYQYDAQGNRTNLVDALGNVTQYTYDPVFNEMTSLTDPNGRTTIYQYDSLGNRTNEIDPLLQTESWTYDSNGNVLTDTDKDGHTTTYKYDAFGDRTNLIDALGYTTTYAYDSVGNLIATEDALGRTTTFGYDGLNRLLAETNALGGVTSFTYDGVGREISSTDADGRVTQYAYDQRGRLIQTLDPLGGTVTYGYDADNNRVAETNQLDNPTHSVYDSENRRIAEIDALGGISAYGYDLVGNVTTNIDANGHVTTYMYDALNRKIERTDPLGHTTLYDYSTPGGPPCCSPTIGSGLVTRLEDADGHVTFYNYDELDRLTEKVKKQDSTNDTINPLLDAVTTYTYDPVGNCLSVTDPAGNTTTTGYDALNRSIGSTNAAGDITLYAYDPVGNVLDETAPNGNVTTYIYDDLNRQTSASDSVGLLTANTYDSVGNRLSATDADGHTTSYDYDALNRVITTIDPLGLPTVTLYDGVGNLTTNIDRNGHTSSYQYDALNRRIATYDALGNTTRYAYDAVGNGTNVLDPNGHATSYLYDPLNRKLSERYADAPPNTITYTYDPVGNLLSRTDQNGQVTAYSYSDLNYLTNRNYLPSGEDDRFTYDLAGRLLSATHDGWTNTFGYDGANRLVYTTQNGRLMTYSYDIPGRLETNAYPSGRIITQATDGRGRLLTEREGANPPIVTYTYDAANLIYSRTNGNGTVTTYDYDADDRVTSLETSNSMGRVVGFGYAYDFEGNRLAEAKLDAAGDSGAYAYDGLNRLTDYRVGMLSGNTVPAPFLEETWTLDPVGNWDTVVSNAVTETRSYGLGNELLGINSKLFAYDFDGNLIQDAAYAYAYDEENRLIQVQRLSDLAIVGQYSYDAFGRRVMAIANPAGSPATNVYFYDRAQLIEEQDGSGALLASYVYGNYIDEVLTMERGGQTYYYHQNAEWSPHALTDASGNVAERYAYDAYGQVTVLDAGYSAIPLNSWGTPHSAVGNPYLFTGRELDEETGLYFYRARYYDALKGRFLQRDLLGYVDGLNLYEYVCDNPASRIDPSGLRWAWAQHDGTNGSLAQRRDQVTDFVVRFVGLFMPAYGYLNSSGNISATDSSVSAEAEAKFEKPDSTLGVWLDYVDYTANRKFNADFRCDPASGAITRKNLTLDGDRSSGPLTVDIAYSATIDNNGAREHTVTVDVTIVINVGGSVTVSGSVNIGAEAGAQGEGGAAKINAGASFSRSLTHSAGKERGPLVRGFTLRCRCDK